MILIMKGEIKTPIDAFLTQMTVDRKSVRVGKECRSRWSPYH